MKKIGLLLLIILALLAANIFAVPSSNGLKKQTAEFSLDVSYTVNEDATVPQSFADTLKKAQQLLEKVFRSKEFRAAMFKQSYHDSAYSKSKMACFPMVYDPKTGRISGASVYQNLLKEKEVKLFINIKNNGPKRTTMGASYACNYKFTTYDFWLQEKGELARRLARHIAHEFTHIKGYRHDNKVSARFKWGRDVKEDPAYGVGNIVGEILTEWSKKSII